MGVSISKATLLQLLWLIGLVSTVSATLPAQPGDIEILENVARVAFPEQVTFRVEAEGQGDVSRITLLYGTESHQCQAGAARQSLPVEPQRRVATQWEWDLRTSGALPHGTRIWWRWEIEDAQGNRVTTPLKTIALQDHRFRWKSAADGLVTVTWAEGDSAFGTALLAESSRSLSRLHDSLGLGLDREMLLVVYPSVDDVRDSLIYAPEWTGGVAFTQYNIVVTGIGPAELDWARSVIPHELTHLLVGEYAFNCHGARLPTWLDEGLAMYGEGAPGERREKLLQAIEDGQLGSLRSLANGFQANGALADLSYNYSNEVVTYMLDTHGPADMRALLDYVRDGERIDPALRAVYGLDTDGLDSAWRESVGLPPLGISAAATERPATRTPVPTFDLSGGSQSTAPAQASHTPQPHPSSTAAVPPSAVETAAPPPAAQVRAADLAWVAAGVGLAAVLILGGGALVWLVYVFTKRTL